MMGAPWFAVAQAYAAGLGWHVLPLVENGKEPRCEHGFLDATIDLAVLGRWGQRWPSSNIGIRTGRPSRIVVLDIDPRHGGDVTLEDLEAQHGPLPETVEALTGGGGRHLVFKHPGGNIKSAADVLGPGIDVRADGGYIAAPPSVHPSGNLYAWEGAHRPLGPEAVPVADLPAWVLKTMGVAREGRPRKGRPVDEWRKLTAEGIKDGKRDEDLAALMGHLLFNNIDAVVAGNLLQSFNAQLCRPPLEDTHVAKIALSIAERELNRREKAAGVAHE